MKTAINIKTNKEVKIAAQKISEELGLSLSAVINAYLKHFIREKEIQFSIAPQMTPELEEVLKEVESDIKKKKNISPAFSSAKEINKHLNSL
ncbi:MAG: type II toxin-antitoxin system RelB/DinJ family antitoxin [Candidatus Brennerbacteria bacterium]|nr:type II toxin-antitoxin system RelB/DinJ family antitoxin [Candidatus Brennerbacteria bacterium]